MYEGGTRVPLLVRWPAVIKPGTVCDTPVTSTDFYPTRLEALKLNLIPSQHVDGASMVPLLKSEGSVARDAIFWHYPHYGNQGGTPGSSVRAGAHKLIGFFDDNRIELYDLKNDPGEKHDLSQEQPDRVQDMSPTLQQWRQKVEAKILSAKFRFGKTGV